MNWLDDADKPIKLVEGASLVHWNLDGAALVEESTHRREPVRLHGNSILAPLDPSETLDHYLVGPSPFGEEPPFGSKPESISQADFIQLQSHVSAHLARRDVFVQDAFIGSGWDHAIVLRFLTEYAWHSLLVRHLFPGRASDRSPPPPFTLVVAPSFRIATQTQGFLAISPPRRLAILAGVNGGSALQQAALALLTVLQVEQDTLTLPCSAMHGRKDHYALLVGSFGMRHAMLARPGDEPGSPAHGNAWSPDGVFRLCTQTAFDWTGATRDQMRLAPVPPNRRTPAHPAANDAVQPSDLVFLVADSTGVFPPLSMLTPDQARFHFLNGYSATPSGGGGQFHTGFGGPFLCRPAVYGRLLRRRIEGQNARCWLLNTGNVGGPAESGANRQLPVEVLRSLMDAAFAGAYDDASYRVDSRLRLLVPVDGEALPAVPFDPRRSWPDPAAYDQAAARLGEALERNYRSLDTAA